MGARRDQTQGIFHVDREYGYLILCPDKLISVTSIVGSLFCERKTVFGERFRIPFDNQAAFRGVVAHELTEQVRETLVVSI